MDPRNLLCTSAAALLPSALVAAPAQAQRQGPLVLAKSSYFFVGGKLDPAVEGTAPVGHIYVEYMIPQRLRHRTPIVMVHGGSQSGTNFTGTPDGREGWAQYFVRRGYAVYVVDGVGRGRSANWSDVHGPVSKANMARLTQRFVAPERFNLWPQAHLHTQWPGEGKPGDFAFEQFLLLADALDRELHQAAGDQSARDHRAAREDRPLDPGDAFAIRRVCLAGRRPPA